MNLKTHTHTEHTSMYACVHGYVMEWHSKRRHIYSWSSLWLHATHQNQWWNCVFKPVLNYSPCKRKINNNSGMWYTNKFSINALWDIHIGTNISQQNYLTCVYLRLHVKRGGKENRKRGRERKGEREEEGGTEMERRVMEREILKPQSAFASGAGNKTHYVSELINVYTFARQLRFTSRHLSNSKRK